MHFSSLPFFALLTLAVLLPACSEKSSLKSRKDDPDTNHYAGISPTLSLDALENEMAGSSTDFLKSFADDPIPWQPWNQELLVKADRAQVPIFVFVGSALGSDSHRLAREINDAAEFRDLVAERAVCTVVDTHLHPEIGQLSFHLASEIQRSVALPMAIWLSPEGSPIAWYPLGSADGDDLKKILKNASAMITDTWENDSRYAVENSRRDNKSRAERLSYPGRPEKPEKSRDEVFRSFTRQLGAYYSPISKNLDALGGLLPTGTLELLAIGSQSKLLTPEVRARCREAAREVAHQLRLGAMRDPLDGGYFYARRFSSWILPSFSKSLESQANLATTFLQVGSTLGEEDLIAEGARLLETLENEWVGQSLAILSSGPQQDRADLFLWKTSTLDEILTPEEAALAKRALDLSEEGNIPFENDPNAQFLELNTLRNTLDPEDLAKDQPDQIPKTQRLFSSAVQKMRQHREAQGELKRESTLTVMDYAMVLRAQTMRAAATGRSADRQTARKTARQLLRDFWRPETGLARFRNGEHLIPGRGRDYGATSHSLLLLYSLTLEEVWLESARAIFDHALETLLDDSGLIGSVPPADQVIPLQLHNAAMIFGESTLGFSDLVATRLFALTALPKYQELRRKHLQVISPRPRAAVINHSDFVASCALGGSPLQAIFRGDPASPAGRELLAILSASAHLPFVTLRPESDDSKLAPLPELPPAGQENAIVLLQDQKVLGQAQTKSELEALLESIISGDE